MARKGVPVERVEQLELVSVLLEEVFYGFSLLMFGATIWVLLSQRPTHHVNLKIIMVACLLLLVSTAHSVISIIRLTEGFVLYRDTFPGGSVAFFNDTSQWTFAYRHYAFTVQTLLGDGVVLYRCYVVWQSRLIMILPVLLWCASGVFGIGSPYMASHVRKDEVFGSSRTVMRWITLFWASALATSVLTTFLLTYRIWRIDCKAMGKHDPEPSQLRQILHIIIHGGVIYSLALLAAFISFLCRSNFQYGMITSIISITYYMVIIRVGIVNRATKRPLNLSLQHASRADSDLGLEMRVHIVTLTERTVDNGHGSSMAAIDVESNQHED